MNHERHEIGIVVNDQDASAVDSYGGGPVYHHNNASAAGAKTVAFEDLIGGRVARLLVVDDDADVRALVIRRLQQGGHRVQGAADASEALTIVDTKGSPDLVVLDVSIPDLDGLELLTRLREKIRPDLPAVFLSGRMRPEDIAAGLSLGAKYLTKPFDTTALLRAVDSLLTAVAEAQRAPQEW